MQMLCPNVVRKAPGEGGFSYVPRLRTHRRMGKAVPLAELDAARYGNAFSCGYYI